MGDFHVWRLPRSFNPPSSSYLCVLRANAPLLSFYSWVLAAIERCPRHHMHTACSRGLYTYSYLVHVMLQTSKQCVASLATEKKNIIKSPAARVIWLKRAAYFIQLVDSLHKFYIPAQCLIYVKFILLDFILSSIFVFGFSIVSSTGFPISNTSLVTLP